MSKFDFSLFTNDETADVVSNTVKFVDNEANTIHGIVGMNIIPNAGEATRIAKFQQAQNRRRLAEKLAAMRNN